MTRTVFSPHKLHDIWSWLTAHPEAYAHDLRDRFSLALSTAKKLLKEFSSCNYESEFHVLQRRGRKPNDKSIVVFELFYQVACLHFCLVFILVTLLTVMVETHLRVILNKDCTQPLYRVQRQLRRRVRPPLERPLDPPSFEAHGLDEEACNAHERGARLDGAEGEEEGLRATSSSNGFEPPVVCGLRFLFGGFVCLVFGLKFSFCKGTTRPV